MATYHYEKIPEGSLEKAAHKVIPIGLRISYKKEFDRIFRRAWIKLGELAGLKEGDVLTEQHGLLLSRIITEEMAPFLLKVYSAGGCIPVAAHNHKGSGSQSETESGTN